MFRFWRVANKGDKKIRFASCDMFTPNSNTEWLNNSECWRLFEYNSTKDHFVVTGQGVIFEYEK